MPPIRTGPEAPRVAARIPGVGLVSPDAQVGASIANQSRGWPSSALKPPESLYVGPNFVPVNWQATAGVLDRALGFEAVRVMVDNLSGRWLYLPDALRYVAPGIVGFCCLIGRTTQGRASWQAPGVYTDTNTHGSAVVTFLGWDIDAALSPGYSVGVSP